MRTLRFIVDGQIISQDPDCDFDNLVPGSEGYLQAEFIFSPEWSGCAKVAAFWSVMGREYPPQVLKDGKSCMIPPEALKGRKFKVQVIGKRNNAAALTITTDKVTVNQNGGKA